MEKHLRNCIAILTTACLLFGAQGAGAKENKTITTAGTGVAIALPVIAAGITAYKRDWNGTAELAAITLATVGSAFAIKQVVRSRRPDGSDFKSFPSDTAALGASGSAFLWRRYGWEYGLPAFAASQFVSYSRVQAKKHHWYDTAASSAMAWGYAAVLTSRFKKRYNVYSEIVPGPDGAMLHVSYEF
jgi:membrane-associated phospholipid phosphatase